MLGRVKGGLAVDVGYPGLHAGSQADPRPVHNLDALIGQDIPVKIIKTQPAPRQRGGFAQNLAVEEEITIPESRSTLEHLGSEGTVV